jgi:hypothetical protein
VPLTGARLFRIVRRLLAQVWWSLRATTPSTQTCGGLGSSESPEPYVPTCLCLCILLYSASGHKIIDFVAPTAKLADFLRSRERSPARGWETPPPKLEFPPPRRGGSSRPGGGNSHRVGISRLLAGPHPRGGENPALQVSCGQVWVESSRKFAISCPIPAPPPLGSRSARCEPCAGARASWGSTRMHPGFPKFQAPGITGHSWAASLLVFAWLSVLT